MRPTGHPDEFPHTSFRIGESSVFFGFGASGRGYPAVSKVDECVRRDAKRRIEVGFGKLLAFTGAAVAGVAWFRRRQEHDPGANPTDETTRAPRREHIKGVEDREAEVADTTDDSRVDPVDQAIDESFPASDPPSYAGSPRNSENP
jgi:hypothetical protein